MTDANAVTLAANLARQSKRVKELETLLASEKATRNAIIAKGVATERANAELAGALRDIAGNPERDNGFSIGEMKSRLRARTALARHAAGEPAKHPDTERLDWLEEDPQARLAEVRRLIFTDRDTAREAIDAARMEVRHG